MLLPKNNWNRATIRNRYGGNHSHWFELETLSTCSDGLFDPATKMVSLGWVLSDTNKAILAQGEGPADGHPTRMSSYRVELGGSIAILYTIYCICQCQQVNRENPNITMAIEASLVQVAKTLVTLIPATIVAEWVKGYYTGEYREHYYYLNDREDKLATKFNSNPPTAL
jgi:Na+/phosphate symporter